MLTRRAMARSEREAAAAAAAAAKTPLETEKSAESPPSLSLPSSTSPAPPEPPGSAPRAAPPGSKPVAESIIDAANRFAAIAEVEIEPPVEIPPGAESRAESAPSNGPRMSKVVEILVVLCATVPRETPVLSDFVCESRQHTHSTRTHTLLSCWRGRAWACGLGAHPTPRSTQTLTRRGDTRHTRVTTHDPFTAAIRVTTLYVLAVPVAPPCVPVLAASRGASAGAGGGRGGPSRASGSTGCATEHCG